MAKIRPPKYRIRKDVGDLAELKASIKAKGLLQPLVVRPANNHYEVVAGHRRFVSAFEIGMKEVPASIIDASDKEAFEIALMENIQRKTMDPEEEGEAFRRYVSDFGWGGQTELANRLGLSPATISRRIDLVERSTKEVLGYMRAGELSVSHVEELNSLDTESMAEVSDQVVKYGLDVSKTRVAVQAVKAGLKVDQAIHHVLNFMDTPLVFKERIDEKVNIRNHVSLSVKTAIKSVTFYLEELPDGQEKKEWNEQVLWPLKKLENIAIRLEKEFNNGKKAHV